VGALKLQSFLRLDASAFRNSICETIIADPKRKKAFRVAPHLKQVHICLKIFFEGKFLDAWIFGVCLLG
jgi:hypothetical protein